MSELVMRIEGMSCDHCVRRVTKALEGTPGVTVKSVQVGSATVDYDGTPESAGAIVASLDRAGYDAKPDSGSHVTH
jgi:copper chaperone CopZ